MAINKAVKRVLFVNEISEIAGTETLLTLIMSHLDRHRYQPVIACPPGPIVERMQQQGIEHIPFQFRLRRLRTGSLEQGGIRIVNPFSLMQKVIEGFALAQIIRQHRIDILHTNSLSAHLAGIVAAYLTQVPIIWHIHTHLLSLLYKLRLPNRLIFVSDFVLRTAFPTTIPAIARRIYNGIDLTAFDPATHPATDLRKELDLTPEQPLVVMIGYLDLIKGQHEVIEAWPQVLRTYPTARLVLVGRAITPNGEVYAAALRTQVKTLGIEANVTFLGYRSDISAILHAADIYVSFTLNDTLSMVVIEAMTMRKAIIGANSGGLPELITPHESGLLVDKGDIAGMAQAIQDLLADPSVRQRYGTTAREKALSQFDIQQCVTAIQQVYDELC